MCYNEYLLFYLLRIGLGTESKYDFKFSEKPDWQFIFKMSAEQGVLAIVFDGVENLIDKGLIDEAMQPSRSAKMQWAMNVIQIENTYNTQYIYANEIADKFAENGIKTVVLKGIDSSVHYPKPNHRPCGDLDCFLFDDFERGNNLLAQMGADNEEGNYKHSHYIYKHFLIENHHSCTPIKGPKRNKLFEKELQKLLYEEKNVPINGSNLLSPCPLFNALFLTIHSWRHFYVENIGLRHVCDWAMLLKKYNDKIDWNKFVEILNIRDKKMVRFARCVSYIAHFYMGAPMPSVFNDCKYPDNLSERVLRAIIDKDDTERYDTLPFFKKKFLIFKASLLGNWKIKEFCEHSNLYYTYRLMYEYIFERNPHL